MSSQDVTLERVYFEPVGSALVAPAVAGDLVLVVDWTVDFTEDGGDLSLAGVAYEYDAFDPTAMTITLSPDNPVIADVDTDTGVFVLNGDKIAEKWTALVSIEENDQPLPVAIGADWVPYFTAGDEQAGATVTIVDDGRGSPMVVGRPDQLPPPDFGSNVTLSGPDNRVLGDVTAGAGISTPQARLNVGTTWASTKTTTSYVAGIPARGLFDDGAGWYFTASIYGGNVQYVEKGTGTVYPVVNTPANFSPLGGIVRIGTTSYVLGRDGNRGSNWFVYVYNSSWAKTGEWPGTLGALGASNDELAIGVDGAGGLLIVKRTAGGNLYVTPYSTSGVSSASVLKTGVVGTPTGVVKSTVDTATVRYVVSFLSHSIMVLNTATGAQVSAEGWRFAGDRVTGISFDGTLWHTFDTNRVYHYTNNGVLNPTWDVAPTWRDDDPAGEGTAETRIGPIRTVTPLKRAQWIISLGESVQDDGTVDGASSAGIYAAPTGDTLALQAVLSAGATSATFDTLLTSGTPPPTESGFAKRVSTTGRFLSQATDSNGDPLSVLAGDGNDRAALLIQSDTETVAVVATGVVATYHVVFDVPFTTVPSVACSADTATPHQVHASHGAKSATGFTIYVVRDATTGPTAVDWVATTAH